MSQPTFTIKQGDTAPIFRFTLTGVDGVAQDLTGATVRLSLRNAQRQLVVNRAVCVVDTPLQGVGHFAWQAANTAAAGPLEGELEATLGDGSILTFPNDGYLTVLVTPQLA